MKHSLNKRVHADRPIVCRMFQVVPSGIKIVSPFINRSGVNPAKSHRLYAAAGMADETECSSLKVILSESGALSSKSCNAFTTPPMETEYFENQSLIRLRRSLEPEADHNAHTLHALIEDILPGSHVISYELPVYEDIDQIHDGVYLQSVVEHKKQFVEHKKQFVSPNNS